MYVFLVCSSYCLRKSRPCYKFMDLGNSFSNMGINYSMVFVYINIQVNYTILIKHKIFYLFILIPFYIFSNFWPVLNVGAVMLGNDRMLFSSPVFWLGLILIPTAVLLLDVTAKTYVFIFLC